MTKNIDRTHSAPSFSAKEMDWLHARDRVMVYDGATTTDLEDPSYSYVVFTESVTESAGKHYTIDAWRVNAKGEKYEADGGPVPVMLSELKNLDFADPDIRLPMAKFIRSASANPQFYSAREVSQFLRDGLLVHLKNGPGDYGVLNERPTKGSAGPFEVQPIDFRGMKMGPAMKDVATQAILPIEAASVPEEIRRYLARDYKTFVFGIHRDSQSNLALGSGRDGDEARADAIVRMGTRFPGLLDKVVSPKLEMQVNILRAVKEGTAAVASMLDGAYPLNLGHEYMSHATVHVAEVLTSDVETCRLLLLRGPDAGLKSTEDFLKRKFEAIGGTTKVDFNLVDWAEVLDSFPESVAMRDVEPVEPAKPGTPGASMKSAPKSAASAAIGAETADAQEIKGRRIDPEVLAVLARCEVEGALIRLPEGQLPAKLYKKVDEVLQALGGKWIGRKVRAHQFEEDPSAVLDVAVGTGTFVKVQDFGFFPTQPTEVKRVLDIADVQPGMKVLEPSAGQGAFAIPLVELVGHHDLVTVCELLPGNARKLRDAGFSAVNEGDFLSIDPMPIFDRIIMNPPFGGGVDVDHVMHATKFLKPDGRLVAITSPSWESKSSKKAQAFRDFMEEVGGDVQDVDAGAFKAVGTNVSTRIVTMDAQNFPWNQVERVAERQRA